MTPVRFRPEVRTQPNGLLPIRWGHPLTYGLVFSTYNSAYDWQTAPVNYVNGAPGSVNTSITEDDGTGSAKPSVITVSGKGNGTSSVAKHSRCNLSLQRRASFSWWAWWDAFANNNQSMWGYATTNWISDNGILVIPNESVSGAFTIGIGSGGGTFVTHVYTRPSAAVWHHYGLSIDRNAAPTAAVLFFIDGVQQTPTGGTTTFTATDFGANQDFTFYGARSSGGAQLFGACRIACFNAWSGRYLTQQDHLQMMANSLRILNGGNRFYGESSVASSNQNRWFLMQ